MLPTAPTATPCDAPIGARLARVRPHCLSSAEWALARNGVIDAVVATAPPSEPQAKAVASALCRFLAADSRWARDGAPDLAALLTSDAIERFISSPVLATCGPSHRRNTRSALRRIARALGAMRPSPAPRREPPNRAGSVFWPAVASFGPTTALIAAYRATGPSFHSTSIPDAGALALDLSVLAASVADGAADKLGPVQTAGRALRAAEDVTVVPAISPARVLIQLPTSSGLATV